MSSTNEDLLPDLERARAQLRAAKGRLDEAQREVDAADERVIQLFMATYHGIPVP